MNKCVTRAPIQKCEDVCYKTFMRNHGPCRKNAPIIGCFKRLKVGLSWYRGWNRDYFVHKLQYLFQVFPQEFRHHCSCAIVKHLLIKDQCHILDDDQSVMTLALIDRPKLDDIFYWLCPKGVARFKCDYGDRHAQALNYRDSLGFGLKISQHRKDAVSKCNHWIIFFSCGYLIVFILDLLVQRLSTDELCLKSLVRLQKLLCHCPYLGRCLYSRLLACLKFSHNKFDYVAVSLGFFFLWSCHRYLMILLQHFFLSEY